MPAYALPGTEVAPRRARILGVVAVVLVIAAVVVWRVVPNSEPAGQIRVALITAQVGEGVAPGTDVRLDGVRVGSVASIDRLGSRGQRITVSLQGSQLFGLTDELSVDYVTGNLFGISAVDLHSGGGGALLTDGSIVDLTGRNAGRLRDATLSALLESTGGLTADVLTPKLAALLATAARDVRALSPMLQAIGTTVRSFTDTQQLPTSLLFDRFGSTLDGVPAALTGGLAVLRSAYTNQYLSTPEHMLQADLDTLHRLGGTLAGHADAIGQIKVEATVTMPGSPVQGAADRVGNAVVEAYNLIGGNIRRMADNTQLAAKSYEEVDQAFANQLRRYADGEQTR